jgi:DNA-binding IclR family transcriptional regulator
LRARRASNRVDEKDMTSTVDSRKTPSLPSVQRALDVLDHISSSYHGLTLAQLTRSLGFPRSTMHCLLLTLERLGYIQRSSPRGPYLCGPRLLELSSKTLAGSSLREIGMPVLRSLMQRTKLVTHMAMLDRHQVKIIAQIAPLDALLTTSIGQHLDMHCTALGKAIAAFLPESKIAAMFHGRTLLPHNENTIVSQRRLLAEFAAVRQRGYAVDDEEDAIGYRCMGAPVLDASNLPLAAISVMGSTAEISTEGMGALASDLKRAAGLISASIQRDHYLGSTQELEEAVGTT